MKTTGGSRAANLAPMMALLLPALAAGCNRSSSQKNAPSDPPLAPLASSLAPSQAAPSATSVRYIIGKGGKASLDMPAPKEHIKGDLTGTGGAIDVDLKDLANTRGSVEFDMTTLATHTFDDADKNAGQTKHARTWLQVGEVADPKMRQEFGKSVFAIRSIANLSATSPASASAQKDDKGDYRRVTLTAHGELLLHGRKVDKTADLEVRLRYPAGATPDAKPSAIEIRTSTPFTVTLAEHDVKPRDAFGKFAQGSLGLLGTKVAETAAVSLDLVAFPDSA